MNEFERVYAQGGWDGCGSGPGSTPEFCAAYNDWLSVFLRCHSIKAVLDLGCGDWQSTRLIDWTGIYYIGMDIVPQVIERNRREFGQKNVAFLLGDFLSSWLPAAELLIVKDVVHHLTHAQVRRTVELARDYEIVLWVVDMGLEVPHGAWPDPYLVDYFKALPRIFEFDTKQPGYKYKDVPKSVLLSLPRAR